jgi:biotin carboxyl carrier protein
MKMENEIRSIRAGTVKNVKIGAGQRVEQNEVLVILE